MISAFIVLVVSIYMSYTASKYAIILFILTVMMTLSYTKWNSHFSVVLINLEFFTLVLMLLVFYLLSISLINMPVVMVLITSLVIEACLGLSMLTLLTRWQKNESLMSGIN